MRFSSLVVSVLATTVATSSLWASAFVVRNHHGILKNNPSLLLRDNQKRTNEPKVAMVGGSDYLSRMNQPQQPSSDPGGNSDPYGQQSQQPPDAYEQQRQQYVDDSFVRDIFHSTTPPPHVMPPPTWDQVRPQQRVPPPPQQPQQPPGGHGDGPAIYESNPPPYPSSQEEASSWHSITPPQQSATSWDVVQQAAYGERYVSGFAPPKGNEPSVQRYQRYQRHGRQPVQPMQPPQPPRIDMAEIQQQPLQQQPPPPPPPPPSQQQQQRHPMQPPPQQQQQWRQQETPPPPSYGRKQEQERRGPFSSGGTTTTASSSPTNQSAAEAYAQSLAQSHNVQPRRPAAADSYAQSLSQSMSRQKQQQEASWRTPPPGITKARQEVEATGATTPTMGGAAPATGTAPPGVGATAAATTTPKLEQVMDGLDILYPPTELESRNAKSRSDGYWPYMKGATSVAPQEFTYGEFDIPFFAKLLDSASKQMAGSSSSQLEGKVFCDVGSGTGRLVLGAAALYPQLKCSRGVEILPGIHSMAEDVVAKCNGKLPAVVGPELPLAPIDLICGSISDSKVSKIDDVDLFFIFSTCMSDEIRDEIAYAIGKQCKVGSMVICTDYELITSRTFCKETGKYFQLEQVSKTDDFCEVVGGLSTAYTYRLIESAAAGASPSVTTTPNIAGQQQQQQRPAAAAAATAEKKPQLPNASPHWSGSALWNKGGAPAKPTAGTSTEGRPVLPTTPQRPSWQGGSPTQSQPSTTAAKSTAGTEGRPQLPNTQRPSSWMGASPPKQETRPQTPSWPGSTTTQQQAKPQEPSTPKKPPAPPTPSWSGGWSSATAPPTPKKDTTDGRPVFPTASKPAQSIASSGRPEFPRATAATKPAARSIDGSKSADRSGNPVFPNTTPRKPAQSVATPGRPEFPTTTTRKPVAASGDSSGNPVFPAASTNKPAQSTASSSGRPVFPTSSGFAKTPTQSGVSSGRPKFPSVTKKEPAKPITSSGHPVFPITTTKKPADTSGRPVFPTTTTKPAQKSAAASSGRPTFPSTTASKPKQPAASSGGPVFPTGFEKPPAAGSTRITGRPAFPSAETTSEPELAEDPWFVWDDDADRSTTTNTTDAARVPGATSPKQPFFASPSSSTTAPGPPPRTGMNTTSTPKSDAEPTWSGFQPPKASQPNTTATSKPAGFQPPKYTAAPPERKTTTDKKPAPPSWTGSSFPPPMTYSSAPPPIRFAGSDTLPPPVPPGAGTFYRSPPKPSSGRKGPQQKQSFMPPGLEELDSGSSTFSPSGGAKHQQSPSSSTEDTPPGLEKPRQEEAPSFTPKPPHLQQPHQPAATEGGAVSGDDDDDDNEAVTQERLDRLASLQAEEAEFNMRQQHRTEPPRRGDASSFNLNTPDESLSRAYYRPGGHSVAPGQNAVYGRPSTPRTPSLADQMNQAAVSNSISPSKPLSTLNMQHPDIVRRADGSSTARRSSASITDAAPPADSAEAAETTRTESLSGVNYKAVAEGLDVLYPPSDLASRNAASRTDGYWPFVQSGDDAPVEFTYGEFDVLFFAQLLDEAAKYMDTNTFDDKIVCDIGSGAGRLVLGAAALHPNLAKSQGVEILPGIHEMAIENVAKCQNGLPPNGLSLAPIELTCGSISDPSLDISNVDLFFIASTCMPESVLEEIASAIGKQCHTGTLVISTDYELPTKRTLVTETGQCFKLEKLTQMDGFCWVVGGVSTAFIYQLVETAAYGGLNMF